MGKLGKKARKFAKKNLQSVLRRKRKTKAVFKKKSSSKEEHEIVENQVESTSDGLNTRNTAGGGIEVTSLDEIFSEADSDVEADASESDGYLSEDSSCSHVAESEALHDSDGNTTLSTENTKIQEEFVRQKKKLDRLKKKDPEFVEYLKSYKMCEISHTEEMYSDEDEKSNHMMKLVDEDKFSINKGKFLTSCIFKAWCRRITDDHSDSALVSLLNAYRAACHFGTESTGLYDIESCYSIQNSETFCDVLTFVLQEVDSIFRGLLKLSSSNCKKETILELKNTSRWKKVKPLLKSYLRSTLFLLSQATDSEILALCLTRLRASIIFFAAFPSLLHRLIKISVRLWATAGGALSSCSFHIIRDVAVVFSSSCFDTCLTKTQKAYISRCKVIEFADIQHIEFLKNSFVELCSLDVQNSCSKALLSIQQLAKILQQGLRAKQKEAIKSICSWQYVNCIEIWVMFISAHVRDHGLQPLLYMTIQLVNGVAYLFPGPRYFPFRLKCIQWLSRLSSSSGIFIPVASLVLDILEYNIGREGGKREKSIEFSSFLKLPKHWLKSRKFQEECVFSAIELVSVHFAQWSYHISFPDLATIPLIRLRRFHEITNIESTKRLVKRLIDQVEQNVEFVQKKRDDVAYSPKDHQLAESFLQLEKGTLNSPFTQYYRSVIEKAAARKLHMKEKISFLKQKNTAKRQLPNNIADANGDAKKSDLSLGNRNSKSKKRRISRV